MKLYLVRHAQSLRNEGKEHDKLSETGIEQSKRLGLFLKDKHIDYIYCSEYGRTKETLNNILKYIKIKKQNIKIKGTINEQEQGVFKEKAEKEYFFHILELKDKGVDLYNYKPGGTGESFFDVEKRAQEFLDFLKKNHKENDHVLMISHGMFLRFFILRLLKLPNSEGRYFTIHNASLSDFELDKDFNVIDFEIDEFKHLLKYSSYKRADKKGLGLV